MPLSSRIPIPWKESHTFCKGQRFISGVQLHNDFNLPVKHAYLLAISNTGYVFDQGLPENERKGHPDAYFYDEANQILVLVEVKVGAGELYKAQLDSHKTKVKQIPVDHWVHAEVTWDLIKKMLKENLKIDIIKITNINLKPINNLIMKFNSGK